MYGLLTEKKQKQKRKRLPVIMYLLQEGLTCVWTEGGDG